MTLYDRDGFDATFTDPDLAESLAADVHYLLDYIGPHAHRSGSGEGCVHCSRVAVARANVRTADERPTRPSLPADTDLRDRIRRAICEASGFTWLPDELMEPDEYGEHADAVLAILPAPADLGAELAAYRRAVRRWEVSERGTYIPHSSLRTIGLASGVDILGSVRHLRHFERVEQAEAENERLRADLCRMADTVKAAEKRVRDLHAPIQHMRQTWCQECSVRRSTGPRAEEWVAYIPYPCPTIDALEDKEPTT